MFDLFNWVWNMLVLAFGTLAFSGGLFFITIIYFIWRDILGDAR